MGLKKGVTNNPNGRPKGSLNKLNENLRETFSLLINENISTLKSDLLLLQPKERVLMIIKMSEFILPKLRAVESEKTLTTEEYNSFLRYKKSRERIENMSEEELQTELKRLRESQERSERRRLSS